MKLGRSLLLLFTLCQTGCAFFGYAAQNMVSSPYDAIQEYNFRHRTLRKAREAWQTTPKDEGCSYSAAYVKGFEDGFVDFVDADGTGDAPASPPIHLRRGLVQSDRGPQDIEDWYAGFRHGVRVARESGLREKAVCPISQPPRTLADPIPAKVIIPQPLNEMPFPKINPESTEQAASQPISAPSKKTPPPTVKSPPVEQLAQPSAKPNPAPIVVPTVPNKTPTPTIKPPPVVEQPAPAPIKPAPAPIPRTEVPLPKLETPPPSAVKSGSTEWVPTPIVVRDDAMAKPRLPAGQPGPAEWVPAPIVVPGLPPEPVADQIVLPIPK